MQFPIAMKKKRNKLIISYYYYFKIYLFIMTIKKNNKNSFKIYLKINKFRI